MSSKTCIVDGCAGHAIGRQLCNKHYLRWKRGDASITPGPDADERRILSLTAVRAREGDFRSHDVWLADVQARCRENRLKEPFLSMCRMDRKL
jgi:hypothetical protein